MNVLGSHERAILPATDRVVLFDGECVMCSAAARLLMRLDRRHVFILGTVQSPEGRTILQWHGLPTASYASFVLCEGSHCYLRSTAYVRIAARLGFPWSLAAAVWVIPRPIRDWFYDLIARNRFRLFGRRDHCMVLSPADGVRLLSSRQEGAQREEQVPHKGEAMQLEYRLDLIHARLQRMAAVQYFAAFTRLVLAVGFIAPGMHKVIGQSFITPEAWTPDHPIRLFFEALFSAGELYVFIGVIQTVAGVFLLFHRTAPLGSVLFLPVISGIFLVTLGLNFGVTTYIAGSMLLASIFMVCWYYPAWKRLLFPEKEPVPSWRSAKGLSVACSSWYSLAAAGVMITLVARSVIPMKPFFSLSWVLLGAAILLGLIAIAVNLFSMPRRAAQPGR